MRGIVYTIIVSLLVFAPVERVNVAQLLPIRSVAVYDDGGELVLETDTGHKGRGAGAEEALRDLKAVTPAVVYLDTAQYLLIAHQVQNRAEELRAHLKGSVKVAICDARDKVALVTDYLSVHRKLPKLRDWSPPQSSDPQ